MFSRLAFLTIVVFVISISLILFRDNLTLPANYRNKHQNNPHESSNNSPLGSIINVYKTYMHYFCIIHLKKITWLSCNCERYVQNWLGPDQPNHKIIWTMYIVLWLCCINYNISIITPQCNMESKFRKLRPRGRAMGCLLWCFWRTFTAL